MCAARRPGRCWPGCTPSNTSRRAPLGRRRDTAAQSPGPSSGAVAFWLGAAGHSGRCGRQHRYGGSIGTAAASARRQHRRGGQHRYVGSRSAWQTRQRRELAPRPVWLSVWRDTSVRQDASVRRATSVRRISFGLADEAATGAGTGAGLAFGVAFRPPSFRTGWVTTVRGAAVLSSRGRWPGTAGSRWRFPLASSRPVRRASAEPAGSAAAGRPEPQCQGDRPQASEVGNHPPNDIRNHGISVTIPTETNTQPRRVFSLAPDHSDMRS